MIKNIKSTFKHWRLCGWFLSACVLVLVAKGLALDDLLCH